jgi:hypothetical protein
MRTTRWRRSASLPLANACRRPTPFRQPAKGKADRLKKERSSKPPVETTLSRARKAENLVDEIMAELKKLHVLKN